MRNFFLLFLILSLLSFSLERKKKVEPTEKKQKERIKIKSKDNAKCLVQMNNCSRGCADIAVPAREQRNRCNQRCRTNYEKCKSSLNKL